MRHERWISQSNFSQQWNAQRKWYNSFYNRKYKYEDDLDAYRKSILQTYFNSSLVLCTGLFAAWYLKSQT